LDKHHIAHYGAAAAASLAALWHATPRAVDAAWSLSSPAQASGIAAAARKIAKDGKIAVAICCVDVECRTFAATLARGFKGAGLDVHREKPMMARAGVVVGGPQAETAEALAKAIDADAAGVFLAHVDPKPRELYVGFGEPQ